MDLRDLKTFLHLAESRHFGRSARAMHVSPSTLSRQIQRLEEDLGQPLFVRDNRTVTLTEAGEELRVFAQQTLLQYQQLRHTIDQQGPSLLHDDNLERTSNGWGVAGELNWQDLLRVDAGSWYSKAFKGESLPLLSQVAERCPRAWRSAYCRRGQKSALFTSWQ